MYDLSYYIMTVSSYPFSMVYELPKFGEGIFTLFLLSALDKRTQKKFAFYCMPN